MPKKREFIYAENAEYQKEYQRSLHKILISFNPRNETDVFLWDHLQSKGSGKVIPYIKSLIMKDIEKGENQ